MSWLFSQALVEEYSGGASLGGEPCAQLNVMPTAQPFWRNDKMMEPSRLSRFGLTLRLLTASHGEDLLMSFLAAFRAKTSALLAAETVLTESDQVSGFKWPGSFAKFDPTTCSWRTRQCSLLGGLEEFSETWPRYGLMRDGECIQQPMLELTTSGNESGFAVPTPTCTEGGRNKSASSGAAIRPSLGMMAKHDLWPTPTVCGNYNRKGASATSGDGLATAVWRTPNASDGRKWSNQSLEDRQSKGQQIRLNTQVSPADGKGGQLNPMWVEWLMGWPLGQSELQPLETAKFQEWRQQHGDC